MKPGTRFDAPRSLARALAELARQQGGEHAAEAELRAALPQAMGAWLHGRLLDVRRQGTTCTLVLREGAGPREAEALGPEILRELRRRLGASAPSHLRIEAAPGPSPRPKRPEPTPLSGRPLVAEALSEVADEALRRRLARWAGVALGPADAEATEPGAR